VTQACAGAVTLDDGTGRVDLSLGLSRANPGLEIDTVGVGSYVLAIGKLVARKQGSGTHLNIRPRKVGEHLDTCARACLPASLLTRPSLCWLAGWHASSPPSLINSSPHISGVCLQLLHLSCDPDAAAQRMMHWSHEVLELHRVLEAAAVAPAAAPAPPAAAAAVAAS
jgi:hypothetical protein